MKNAVVKHGITQEDMATFERMPNSKPQIEKFLREHEFKAGKYIVCWSEFVTIKAKKDTKSGKTIPEKRKSVPRRLTIHLYDKANKTGIYQGTIGDRVSPSSPIAQKINALEEKLDQMIESMQGDEGDDEQEDDEPTPQAGIQDGGFITKLAGVAFDPKFSGLMAKLYQAKSIEEYATAINSEMATNPGIVPELIFKLMQ